jgi:hypothetical protein
MSTESAGFYRVNLASVDSLDRARVTPRLVFRAVIVPFAFTRLLLILAGLFAIHRLPGARAPGWDLPTGSPMIDIWSHFDARWYESIAKGRYEYVPGQMCNVPFAPLFPILMRAGCLFNTNSDTALFVSGIVVSNAALIVSLIYLIALLLLEGYDEITAARAAWYVLIFPTTLFLSAGYPMSLYMALAMAAFYHARKDQWRFVGLLAGLAALSRPDGLLLTGGLAVEYYLQHGFTIRRELFNLAWGPIGLLSWIAYQGFKFGHPLAFISAQAAWNSCPIWTVLFSSRVGLQLGPPAFFITLTILGLTRLRPSYSAFTLLMGAVMFTANRYWSITRFILVLFPAFMMLAILARRHRWLHLAYTIVSAPLSGLLMMRFALNQWVA